jgi:hypothetical protein
MITGELTTLDEVGYHFIRRKIQSVNFSNNIKGTGANFPKRCLISNWARPLMIPNHILASEKSAL